MDKITDFNFDAIYLINLKRKPAKLAWALNELAEIGIKPIVFDAIDAIEMELSTTKIGKDGNAGAIGCLLSHQGCFRDALMNGFEKILIFEDDIIKPDATAQSLPKQPLRPYFDLAPRFISDVANMDPDLIFWGYDLRGSAPKMVSEHVSKPNGGLYGSHAISYHNTATIQQAFDLTLNMAHWDVAIDQLAKQINAFMPIQSLFGQVRSQTDIWANHRRLYIGDWCDKKFKAFCKSKGLNS